VVGIEILWLLIPFLLSVVGAVFLVLGIRNLVRTRRFVGRASSATGTVTDIKNRRSTSHSSEGSRIRRYPVVRFQTQEGRTVEFESETGTSSFSQGPGEQVEVLYDPLRPEEARIKTFIMLWFAPLIFSVLGLFMFVFGTLFTLIALVVVAAWAS
jgi:Protein of unknown function (DUF3592)